MTILERYWDKVDVRGPDECWLWTASTAGPMEHGNFWVGNNSGVRVRVYAHRFAWMLANAADPGDLKVRHSCDTPRCQNPAHLLLGSQGDNVRDMFERGRARPYRAKPGELHHNAKLTAAQVTQIRALRDAGMLHRELAAQFGVGRTQITRILNGDRWKETA